MSKEEAEQKGALIAVKVADYLRDKIFQNIHIFLPQQNKNEINTWQIISLLRTEFSGIRISVPRVIPGTAEMEHFLLNENTSLIQNQWGIPEPDPEKSEKVAAIEPDIVLLPLLAFDTSGYRVGYGGGFYDRFLAQCKSETLRVGLSFFPPVELIEDINVYDIRMNACITDTTIYRW